MATRSTIGILRVDGSITANYCHSDGYFSWNGRMLHTHYGTTEKARELVALGACSSLQENVGEKHDFSWHQSLVNEMRGDGASYDDAYAAVIRDPRHKMSLFYIRDRGDTEDWLKGRDYSSIDDFWASGNSHEYLYLFDEARGAWLGCRAVDGGEGVNWHLLSDLAEANWEDGCDDRGWNPSVRTVQLVDDGLADAVASTHPTAANGDLDDPAARAIF